MCVIALTAQGYLHAGNVLSIRAEQRLLDVTFVDEMHVGKRLHAAPNLPLQHGPAHQRTPHACLNLQAVPAIGIPTHTCPHVGDKSPVLLQALDQVGEVVRHHFQPFGKQAVQMARVRLALARLRFVMYGITFASVTCAK